LKGIVDNQLSVVTVVSDRAIKSSDEAQKIIQALTRAAVQHNYIEIIRELGSAEAIGSSLPDPFLDVPEVRPVAITTVGFSVLAPCYTFDPVPAYLE
jgi:DNA-directed RNA polymerase